MAKKNNELTKEEILEQALVPEDEQPYEALNNWMWIRLNVATEEIKNGTTINQNKENNGVKVTRIESIQNNQIDFNRVGFICDVEKIKDTDWYNENDIALSHINSSEHVGKAAIIKKQFLPLVHGMNLLRIRFNIICNPYYFYYYTQSFQYKDSILKRINMAVNQVSINQKQLGSIELPIPPLDEQKRIVERIESLFEKLDKAKEIIQEALDSFENRKAAILHNVFSGELTKKWREENEIGMESWKKCNLQSVCIMKIIDGTHQTPTYCDEEYGFPFISAKDVTSGKIDWSKIKYIIPELHEKLYKRIAPQRDDVLLAKNGTTGIAALVDTDKVFDIYVTLAVLRPDKTIIIPEYLHCIVNSPICKNQFDEHLTGIGVPNLHLRDIKEVFIPLPTLNEQAIIVEIIKNLLVKEKQARENIEDVLNQINLMKKSILARAFHGELGANDPTEESAMELLKEILNND